MRTTLAVRIELRADEWFMRGRIGWTGMRLLRRFARLVRGR